MGERSRSEKIRKKYLRERKELKRERIRTGRNRKNKTSRERGVEREMRENGIRKIRIKSINDNYYTFI